MPRNPLADEIERKAMAEVRDQLAGIRKDIAKEIEAAMSGRPGGARQAQAAPPSSAPVGTLRPLAAPAKVVQQELEAEDVAGLPAPKTSSSKGSEKTPFRLVMNAQVAAELSSVLAFYRRELGKRDWKEDAAKAVVKADQAFLAYTSPDGPGGALTLHAY